MNRFRLGFVVAICVLISPAAASADGGRFTAPVALPSGTPVRIDTPDPDPGPIDVELIRDGEVWRVAFQKDAIDDIAWFQLPFDLKAGDAFEWSLLFLPDPVLPPAPRWSAERGDGDLVVRYGRQELLRYAIAERKSDEADKDYLTRSGYFHPVRTLAGDLVTDDFSPDHAHQHGIFFAWTESRYGDTKTEFWNQHLRRGTIRHAGLGPSGGGAVLAGFETKQVYRLPESDEAVLEETWQARCFALDAQTWLLDLTVKQIALTDVPFVNQKYHYGGLGLRGARHWTPDVASFLTSERKDRLAGNATRPLWSALSGPVESRKPTLAVLDCPSNFRYPTPVRLHPSMPYFAIAPMIEGEFEISKERPFVARYGVVVTSDAVAPERLDSLQAAFAADLTVRSGDR